MLELRRHRFSVIKQLQALVKNNQEELEVLVGGKDLLMQAFNEQDKELIVETDTDSDTDSSLLTSSSQEQQNKRKNL